MTTSYVIAAEEGADHLSSGSDSDIGTSEYDSGSPSTELTASPTDESALTASDQLPTTPRHTTDHSTLPSILKQGHFAERFRKRSLSNDDFANQLYPSLNDDQGQQTEENHQESISAQNMVDNQTPSTNPKDQNIEQNPPKEQVNLPILSGVNTGLQANSPLYRIIGISTAAALLGAGTAALYNKVARNKVSRARVAAVLWFGTAVTMACYYYGPTLCPCLFGGAEE
jgi:hypothetical protein